ncbi:ferrous iron transport protein B [Campylobacter lanienae]|uniref:Ferrous iron transport protein B n=2 Tax=Campylobacter lanienae TaxID=75658 RepID=A0ABY3G8C2_9BACT|nr:ferrous iron transport protein B [Campylobacter lanienae]TWO17311.1 ferrous iron transport protein B [Campylobacter lanienae]TWO29177.1 ferrous iron transport protein B [Campylobacter lanienae]
MKKIIKIALVGQPNVGKTLLINSLSGSHLKVGNFPGVTVEKSEANFKYKDYDIKIIDLPGTYSINDYSLEERITKDFINKNDYDIIINVVDSTNLERNLILTTQIMERNKKMILALNMSDEASKEGINIDVKKFENLLGVPCVSVSASLKSNLNELIERIIEIYKSPYIPNKRIYSDAIEKEIDDISQYLESKNDTNIKELKLSNKDIAIALLKQDNQIYKYLHDKPIWIELSKVIQTAHNNLYIHYKTQSVSEIFMQECSNFVNGAIAESVKYHKPKEINYTRMIDKILINKYIGIPIFLFFMWLIFQLTFTLGAVPMDYIEAGYVALGDMVKESVSSELLASLLADGIIGGVGSVILFLPNIMILFFGIALLETTGYMSRVSFLLDGFFHKFGLHGKSFIPLVTGFGCSVPAFMATRTLKNEKDRLLTLFIINFMSCGARLPVYVLFIGAFAPKAQAGNWLFGIYIFGAILGLIAAKVLRMTAFKGPDEPFVVEMPKYRMPNWKLIWFMVYNKAKMYIKKAGTFILAAAVLIWFASSFPFQDSTKDIYEQKIEIAATDEDKERLSNELENILIENSYLGKVGKFIEPFFAPLEFDWRLSVSIVSGLAAKEVAVSTMGVLYSLGGEVDENNDGLIQKIQEAIPIEVAVAYVLFVMLYNPCLAATIVFGKEAGGYKYIAYLFIFTTFVAYLVSFIGLHIAKLF